MAYQKKYIGTARDPAKNAFAVTPDDDTELQVGRAIFIGTTGDLTVIMANDDTDTPITFKNIASGILLPIEVRYVMATNTTATDIVVVQ